MTLNTAIRGEQIQPATISGGHLNFSNTLGSGIQVVAYDSNEAAFKWQELPTITINEIPSGDIDGSNTEFTLSNTPLDDSVRVYLNGLLQEPGSGNDYTVSGNKITFSIAPDSGDIILVSYLISKTGTSQAGYGYVCGGNDNSAYISMIERVQFPFDSGTTSHVGNLLDSITSSESCNSTNYGFIISGINNIGHTSIIDRFQFPFDSGTSSHVGNLSTGVNGNLASCNNSLYGYAFGGGLDNSTIFSYINRFLFPFNSGSTSHVGNLSSIRYAFGGCNSTTYGYTFGGVGGGVVSIIDRIQFPFDSGAAVHVGDMSDSREGGRSCNSSVYGYFAGGWVDWEYRSSIYRIMFPFDSGIANSVGVLEVNREQPSANNSIHKGFVYGGRGSGDIPQSSISRIEFPFDSGVTNNVGNITGTRFSMAGTDNTDFVSMFV